MTLVTNRSPGRAGATVRMIASNHKETSMDDTPELPEEDWLADLDAELTAAVGGELDLLGEIHPAVPEVPAAPQSVVDDLPELPPEMANLDGVELRDAFAASTLGPEIAAAVSRVGQGWDHLVPMGAELDDGTPLVVMIAPAPDWDPTDATSAFDQYGRIKVLPIAILGSDALLRRLRRDRTHFVTGEELEP